MSSSLEQWDVTKSPSLLHISQDLFKVRYHQSDNITCGPQTSLREQYHWFSFFFFYLSQFSWVPLNVRKLFFFCQAETLRQIFCQSSFPSGPFREQFDVRINCADDSHLWGACECTVNISPCISTVVVELIKFHRTGFLWQVSLMFEYPCAGTLTHSQLPIIKENSLPSP